MKEDIASEAAVTRYRLAYAPLISLSVMCIALHANVLHSLSYLWNIFDIMSQFEGALSSAPAVTWELTADDTSESRKLLGEQQTGGVSLR